jgi:hypothetical protein
MPFSPQSYTGQGIVQQTERSRVGELLGAGFAGLGAGIGKGIEKFQENRAEAKELRSSLPGLAKFMPKEERDEFLAQVEQTDLAGLRGLRRKVLEFGEMQLQQERIAEVRQAREKEEQTGRAIQSILQSGMPQDVPVAREDFTGQIAQSKAEEGRLSSLMKFAPQPEGAMPTGDSLRTLQQIPSESGKTEFDPTYAQFVRENVAPEGQRNQYQKQAAQRAGLINEKYAQSMANKAAQAQKALSQLDEEVSKPLEDVRNQIKLLEEKQRIEEGKPDTRPETAEEFSKRRSETLNKLINENPLAAGTIYSALMGDQDKGLDLDADGRKSMGYAMRMQSAEQDLEDILSEFAPSGTMGSVANMLPNMFKSDRRQQYEATAGDWIAAVLRRESGAAISETEFARDFKRYFPQPGDKEGTVKLKAERRQRALESVTVPLGLGGIIPASGGSQIQPQGLVKEYDTTGNLITR